MTDKGASMQLPEDRRILEGVQDEMEMFDIQLEEMITNLILEERSEAQD